MILGPSSLCISEEVSYRVYILSAFTHLKKLTTSLSPTPLACDTSAFRRVAGARGLDPSLPLSKCGEIF